MLFDYKSQTKENVFILNFWGELVDKNQANKMMDEIEDKIKGGTHKFVLNLAELKYMNSSGISVLIRILTKARTHGGDVALCNVNKKNTELLEITKLNSIFHVPSTLDEAVATLSKK